MSIENLLLAMMPKPPKQRQLSEIIFQFFPNLEFLNYMNIVILNFTELKQ